MNSKLRRGLYKGYAWNRANQINTNAVHKKMTELEISNI